LSKRQSPKPARRARLAPDPHDRNLRQADERAERLTALSRLTRLMTSVTDSAAAFRGIAQAATLLLKAKMAYVWVDQGAETLREGGSYWAGPEHEGRSVRTVPVPRDHSIAGAVLTSRRAEYLEDVQRDPRWQQRALAETGGIHACIAQPLLHHDRGVGALIVGFGRRDAFTAEEKNLAGLLADQAAIAIENARLYEEAGRRQREAELLADVIRSINGSLDLSTVLRRIAEGAREVCHADMAFIALRDPDSDTVGFRQWPGARYDDYRSFRVAAGQGACGLVLSTGRPFRTDNYLEDTRFGPEFLPVARIEELHAYMAVPITIEDRVEGFFSVSNRDDRLLTDRDEQILLRLADHAAVAIRNAWLFADNAARRREAEALTELGGAIASSLELDKILSLVVDRACALLSTQRSAVALVSADRPNTAMLFVASRGMSRAFQAMRPLHPRDGTTPTAIAERRPCWSADLLNDPAFDLTPQTRAAVEAEGYRAVLSVPLLVGDRVLGALVTYRDDVGPFSDRQVELMQAFAHQAALALENSRLYQDSERRRRESEVFAEVAQAITTSLDIDTVLRRITDSAKELVGSDLAMIGFREGDTEAVTIRHRVGSRYTMDRAFSIEPGKGFGGQALVSGRPLRTDDYASDPNFGKEYLSASRKDESVESVSAIVVPIKSEERVVGLLYVANRSRRPFSDHDEATLLRLADEAAVAIRNAQLFASQRESERRYRTLVESSIQGLHIQRDWITLFVNPAFARMLGYEHPNELVGVDTRRWIAADDLARLERDRGARLRGEPVSSQYELQATRHDGSLIWVDIQVSEIVWEGEPAVQSTVLDISERKRAEQALRQSEAQLRQVQKMEAVGQLAGGVAHDFNNLLTVITGRTELLLLRLTADDPHRRDVELVRKTADRAASLTQQLLAFSRKQMLQPRVLDLNGVVAGMAQMLRPLIGETIELVTSLDPVLGRVKADPAQIEQIVLNLAVNARDAMPQGGRLTIETGNVELDRAFVDAHPGSTAGPHAMLSVRDTGTGMSPEVQAHVFEPFFTTKGVGKGTGLGLATVYGIVKQHGGYIRIESAAGAGTTVRIYLARIPAVVDTTAATAAADEPVIAGSGTVLVVEDEGELRDLATEVLGLAGYSVLSAGSPSQAMEIARQHAGPIHLLLTDVVMPEMSGRDLADRLIQTRPDLKILYMSGYTDDAIVHHGVLDPGTVLLQKPFTPDGLTRMVGDVLAGG
jgi:PAS domain S-box-containing protein